ncbi:endonuclease/exonuclease/phosphatase family protein [Streptomyces sp. NPDC059278]|uniref:endonuclease/exonuclease/phosphatase family protein n=1 Tax=Streptomyces sp. NPDC059278 TaxID=3346801 RepID=UPI0036CBB2DD
MDAEHLLSTRQNVLRVVTYNLREGGLDGPGVETGSGEIDASRWQQQMRMLLMLRPDVVCLQEGKYYSRHDSKMAKATAKALGMKWYLAPSRSHGSHLLTLVNPNRVEVLGFKPDAAEGKFHHALARVDLRERSTGWELTVLHTHLDPFSPANRAREASWLTEYGNRDDVILAGDLNSEAPSDPEVTSWDWLPRSLHSRHRFLREDGTYGGSDRRALAAILHSGFQDPVADRGFPPARTVGYWSPQERRDFRSDYVLPGAGLARRMKGWTVVDTEATRSMSDHLPGYGDFVIPHRP